MNTSSVVMPNVHQSIPRYIGGTWAGGATGATGPLAGGALGSVDLAPGGCGFFDAADFGELLLISMSAFVIGRIGVSLMGKKAPLAGGRELRLGLFPSRLLNHAVGLGHWRRCFQ